MTDVTERLRTKYTFLSEKDFPNAVLERTRRRLLSLDTANSNNAAREFVVLMEKPLTNKDDEMRKKKKMINRNNRNDSDSSNRNNDNENNENNVDLVRSLREDAKQANQRARRLMKELEKRDEEIESLKARVILMNREKAMMITKDRVKLIEEGVRAKEVKRAQIEKELVIPEGLAETDVASRDAWVKLLRLEDVQFIRFARAIRTRENAIKNMNKDLKDAKMNESKARELLKQNEKELFEMKIKLSAYEKNAMKDIERATKPMQEEITLLIKQEERIRADFINQIQSLKNENGQLQQNVLEFDRIKTEIQTREIAKEKECVLLLDLLKQLTEDSEEVCEKLVTHFYADTVL
jgi:hypothetical protein